jgi:hypothetical protein
MCVKEEIDDEIKDFNSILSPDTEACEDTSCKVNIFSELVFFGQHYWPVRCAHPFLSSLTSVTPPPPPQNAAAL